MAQKDTITPARLAEQFKRKPMSSPVKEAPQEETDEGRQYYQWKDGRARVRRGFDAYLTPLLSRLPHERVMVVQAEAGLGKTTRIGQALIDNEPNTQVILTQTRRPAVRMNGGFIAQEMGVKPGEEVGWRLKGEGSKISAKTRLTLMVDQSLTNKIRNEGKLPEGVIVIDEAHERTIQTDINLTLIKQLLPHSPNTRVIITSATIDTQKFKRFFNTGDPILAMNDRNYPVDVRPYHLRLGQHHTEGAIESAQNVLDAFGKGKLTVPDEKDPQKQNGVHSGVVLVLLPGKDDIQSAMEEIAEYAKEKNLEHLLEVIACHGKMETEEQQLIEQPIDSGKIRFICATEIVRSAITIPGTIGAIDSLQIKRKTVDANGAGHLEKTSVSGAEADQGKGRSGREGPGFYIPVSFRNEYEIMTTRENPQYWPIPAIQREATTSVALQIAAIGFDIRTLDMLDKPSDNKIAVAVKRLQNFDALDDEGRVTDLGRRLVEFPIDPERAIVLLEAEKRGVLPEAMISMAALQNEGIAFTPPKNAKDIVVDKEVAQKVIDRIYIPGSSLHEDTSDNLRRSILPPWAERAKEGKIRINGAALPLQGGAREVAGLVWQAFGEGTDSDFVATVNAYRAYKAEQQQLHDNYDPEKAGMHRGKWVQKNLQQWSKEHFLNFKKLTIVDRTLSELRDTTRDSGMHLGAYLAERRAFSNEDLTKSLLVGLTDGVSTKTSYGYSGLKGETINIPYASAYKGDVQLILAEGITKDAKGRDMHFASMVAPVQLDWIREVAPKALTEETDASTGYYDSYSDKAFVQRQVKLGNLVLTSERVEADTETRQEIMRKEEERASERDSLFGYSSLSRPSYEPYESTPRLDRYRSPRYSYAQPEPVYEARPSANDERFTMLQDYEDTPTDELVTIMTDEGKRDQGKFRLAVSALANQGEEGMLALLSAKVGSETLDNVTKTLEKTRKDATKDYRAYDTNRAVDSKINKTKHNLDLYRLLTIAAKDPLVKDLFGRDAQAQQPFQLALYRRLDEYSHTYKPLPNEAGLSDEITTVLEAMTSI